jgi:hypothetical protein
MLASTQVACYHRFMKKSPSKASSVMALTPFAKGQVWQIGDVNVAVTQVGKILVHYKRYKAKRPGTPTTMSSIRDLQEYLVTSKAVLVSE